MCCSDKISRPAAIHIFNPLYTSGLFHCSMLDESIGHFRGVFFFDGKSCYQTMLALIRRHMLWRLILVCTVCLRPFYGFPGKNGLRRKRKSVSYIPKYLDHLGLCYVDFYVCLMCFHSVYM